MARPIHDDDEVLELPGELDPEDEVAGLPEAEELALADIGEGPEDVGLDTELGVNDAYEPGIDEDGDESGLDDETLGEVVAVDAEGVDAEGEEAGWLEESEGSPGAFEVEIDADDEDDEDDGGLEGVDDPMLDDLDDDTESSALDEDGDDDSDDLGEEMLRELEGEGARSARR